MPPIPLPTLTGEGSLFLGGLGGSRVVENSKLAAENLGLVLRKDKLGNLFHRKSMTMLLNKPPRKSM